ncbi:hypothetical protein ACGF3J_27925 [Streptomyces sp. NPDC048171]|uniref:hypothetical protein n=1 Tax=Streptomyces sp. NPDC048171 TaxID=3365504 RepID=UPI003720C528
MLSEVDPVVLDFVRVGTMAGLDVSDGGVGDDSSGWHDGLHMAADGVGAAAVAWMGWRSVQDAKSWWRRKQRAEAGGAPGPGGGRLASTAAASTDTAAAKDRNTGEAEPRLKRSVLLDLARRELIEEFDLPADEPLKVREQEYDVSESAYRFEFESGADVYEALVVTKGTRAAVVNFHHSRG